MWEHKHRPRSLDEVALSAAQRRTFLSYIAEGEMRHLALVGCPGQGKSTVASLLEQELAFQAYEINAAGNRGIDIIRETIVPLVRTGAGPGSIARLASANPGAPFRIIRFEEAEGMTTDALRALRTIISESPPEVRFIFTTNAPLRDAAVMDRCHVVNLHRFQYQVS